MMFSLLLFPAYTKTSGRLPRCSGYSLLGHTPEYISDLLTSVANIPGRSILRASSCGNLVVPRTPRRIGDRAFSVAAPRAWNRLPTELKLLDRRTCFVVIWKHFCFTLSTGTKIRIDSVMRPRSSSRGAIQVPQLQLQLQFVTMWTSQWQVPVVEGLTMPKRMI